MNCYNKCSFRQEDIKISYIDHSTKNTDSEYNSYSIYLLFQAGGYTLPFAVIGALVWLFLAIGYFTLPKSGTTIIR